MRLHEFIVTEREQILVEWEKFARTCVPASMTMSVAGLRDHASEMLTEIAADLRDFQVESQASREPGEDPAEANDSGMTAAEEHGAERAESGFATVQVVAEYHALRTSVIRLWTRERGDLGAADVEDLVRFNEAIDQSLAESISEFTESVENAKEMFLAILGHDLRNPLGAIYTSARYMSDTGELDRDLTSQIADRAMRATKMVGDLLDFTRSRLGGGIPVDPAEVDLGTIVQEVVAEIVAAHPGGKVQVGSTGAQMGQWDAARMNQALTNLVGNAVEHSAPGTPVTVQMGGDQKDAEITIHNQGAPIPADRLDGIFNPMKLSTTPEEPSALGPTGNLGLGLYIAERIVHAHRGRIAVESTAARGTTFTVHLPRVP